MRKLVSVTCGIVLGSLSVTVAAAEPAAAAETPASDVATANDESFSHGGQFGVRLGVVGGYRMIFRYDESPFCAAPDPAKTAKDQQKFCGHASPFALETALSFAPIGGLEPFLWGRFGLGGEAETNTNAIIIVGAGARIYTMSDSAFKVFIEPAIGMELEGGAGNPEYQRNNPEYKQDVVFHLAGGPQFDVAKAIGIYADAGITTGILRSIHSTLEVQLGLQARFP